MDNSLDKALEEILQRHRNGYSPQTLMTPDEVNMMTIEAIKKAVERLIGEDEGVQYIDGQPASELDDYAEVRNDLRASQRTLLYGEKR